MASRSLEIFTKKKMLILPQITPIRDAARAMHEQRVGCVIVTGGHHRHPNGSLGVVGLVTDRDLACEALAYGTDPSTPVGDVMTEDVRYVYDDQTLDDVVQVMSENEVRRVPIVHRLENGREKCVGIVTLDDLIAQETVPPHLLAKVVQAQLRLRASQPHTLARHEAKKEHTLNRFNKIMAEAMGFKKGDELAESISFHILKLLVRRLDSTGASHLISGLPNLLQEDLLDETAGPDRRINAMTMKADIQKTFPLEGRAVDPILRGFWKGLEVFSKRYELRNLASHLPLDLQVAFTGKSYVAA